MNTTIFYPISGETIFQSGTTARSFNVPKPGIVYLCGMFNSDGTSLANSINVTINTSVVSFNKDLYVHDADNNSGTQEVGLITNLLGPTQVLQVASSGGGTGTYVVNDGVPPTTATDRNKGPYLPVKPGDVFSFQAGSGNSIIASFLYFN
jgi:hypothetical protein